jgi:hypothetical protein
MYCASFSKLLFIAQSNVLFTEKFTTEVSTFRLSLDIKGGGMHGEITMWPDTGGANQKWHFDDDLTIRSDLGSVLDVTDGSADNGTRLIATSKLGQEHHKFRVVPVSD